MKYSICIGITLTILVSFTTHPCKLCFLICYTAICCTFCACSHLQHYGLIVFQCCYNFLGNHNTQREDDMGGSFSSGCTLASSASGIYWANVGWLTTNNCKKTQTAQLIRNVNQKRLKKSKSSADICLQAQVYL